MESNKFSRTYQDCLAEHIIKQGYTIYGGYVYKRLINGDETNDIDVHVKNNEDMNALAKNLGETFSCKIEDSYWNVPPYQIGLTMSCPDNQKKLHVVDLMIESVQPIDLFKLEYKQVNDKPQIVYRNGTNGQAKKIIEELKKRRFSPWKDMRDKDKLYFSGDKWTDTSSCGFKIKKFLGLVE